MKQQPIGANCRIKWLDGSMDTDTEEVYITFSGYDENVPDPSGLNDEQIFYYSDGENDLQSLMEVVDWNDFVVLGYELNYPTGNN